jgi:hypothetical protein
MQFLNNVDFLGNQIKTVVLEERANAPVTPATGQIWFNTGVGYPQYYDGENVVGLPLGVTAIQGSGAISLNAASGSVTVSISEATDSSDGSMSAADKTKLDGATALDTVSTLVLRDGSGNFAAGTISAALSGNASSSSDSAKLNGQSASYYLDLGNATGSTTASKISDFAANVEAIGLDQMAEPITTVNMNNQWLTGLKDPINASDAVTKAYADALKNGLDFKQACRLATATGANINLSNAVTTVDGKSTAQYDRILVKDQTNAAQNGIYVVGSDGKLTRSTDANDSTNVQTGMFVFVTDGNTNADSSWVLTTKGLIIVDNTDLAIVQFSAAGTFVPHNALSQDGSNINVNVDASTLNINGSNQLYVPTGGITSTQLASSAVTAGKIDSGAVGAGLSVDGTTFKVNVTLASSSGLDFTEAGALEVAAKGIATGMIADGAVTATQIGSAAVTAAKIGSDVNGNGIANSTGVLSVKPKTNGGIAVTSDGVAVMVDGTTTDLDSTGHIIIKAPYGVCKYASNVGDGESVSIVLTHNFGTRDVSVTLYANSSPYSVAIPDIAMTTTNTVTLSFAVAPTADQYRVVIIG